MPITSQHRLEILFKGTPYADTFKYIQNFKHKQIRFQKILYNLDHILQSHTCCDWVFYFRDVNNEHIAFFYLQATPTISEILCTNIVFTVNLDALPSSYKIIYIKELLRLDEQYQQTVKQQKPHQQHTK